MLSTAVCLPLFLNTYIPVNFLVLCYSVSLIIVICLFSLLTAVLQLYAIFMYVVLVF